MAKCVSVNVEHIPSISDMEYRYKCGAKIDEGGFGVVYEGIHLRKGTPVAIKRICKKSVRNWIQLDGCATPLEVAILRKLSHIHGVINVLDFFERPSSVLIIMERPKLCMDMYHHIRSKGILTESEARNLFRQIVQIVVQIHKAGVVHRDIKIENMIVDLSTMEVKLIDFGAAVEFDQDENEEGKDYQIFDTFEGTSVYLPPEWFEKRVYYARAATVWSLGLVLYAMVTGDIPFNDEEEIMYGDPNFTLKVTQCCQDLVRFCLKKKPEDRPGFERILAHPWFDENFMMTWTSEIRPGMTINGNTKNSTTPTLTSMAMAPKPKRKLKKRVANVRASFSVAYNTRRRKVATNGAGAAMRTTTTTTRNGREFYGRKSKSTNVGFYAMSPRAKRALMTTTGVESHSSKQKKIIKTRATAKENRAAKAKATGRGRPKK